MASVYALSRRSSDQLEREIIQRSLQQNVLEYEFLVLLRESDNSTSTADHVQDSVHVDEAALREVPDQGRQERPCPLRAFADSAVMGASYRSWKTKRATRCMSAGSIESFSLPYTGCFSHAIRVVGFLGAAMRTGSTRIT